MSSKVLMINSDDLPSQEELRETIKRLEKDIEVFERLPSCKNNSNVKHLKSVLAFLDILYKRRLKGA